MIMLIIIYICWDKSQKCTYSVKLRVFFHSAGRTLLVLILAVAKINDATNEELILQPFVKDLGEMMFENQPFMFHKTVLQPILRKVLRNDFRQIFLTLSRRKNGPHLAQTLIL